jgi:two-component system NtrC family sensor kinase
LTLRRVKELDTLNHIAQAVTTSLDSNLIIRNALERIQQHFDASYVGLFKWNAETETLVLSQMRKDGALQTVEHRFTKDETLVGEVLQSKKPSMMTSVRVDEARPDKVRDLLDSQRHSWMAAPMMISDQVIGAIEVTSETSGFYTLRQLSVLESIAATLSIALENARLYEELKHALREQERAQAYLIQSEKSAALGRLSATVAHEINNPLQAIQGCLGLFGEEMGGQNRPEKLTRYLSMVEGEIERIASIVRRMRDFYRPSSIGFQAVNLTEVIKSVLDLSAKQLQNSRISLQAHWPEELPQIQANSDHLKQVFLNLILNAIDAMPDGGTLTICVEPAVFITNDNAQAESVRITFSDTGHGMSSEVLAHLFEPFHTTKSHGTGLGLYVSKGIIAAHNGKIEVQSQPGMGTTFTISLPITENHL